MIKDIKVSGTTKLKVGDRVMRADVEETSIPAYRDMRGTVVGFDWTYILVQWDLDDEGVTSRQFPEWLKLVEES